MKEIADGIPGATFRIFEDSGHFAPIEEPEGFRQAVFEFLGVAQVQRGTASPRPA